MPNHPSRYGVAWNHTERQDMKRAPFWPIPVDDANRWAITLVWESYQQSLSWKPDVPKLDRLAVGLFLESAVVPRKIVGAFVIIENAVIFATGGVQVFRVRVERIALDVVECNGVAVAAERPFLSTLGFHVPDEIGEQDRASIRLSAVRPDSAGVAKSLVGDPNLHDAHLK